MDTEDDMFSRYTFNDEDLPDWFVNQEKAFYQPNLPVTKEEIREIRRR